MLKISHPKVSVNFVLNVEFILNLANLRELLVTIEIEPLLWNMFGFNVILFDGNVHVVSMSL